MKKKEDPLMLFKQLGSIKNHFCVTIDDDEKMAVVMMVALQESQMIWWPNKGQKAWDLPLMI